MSRIVLRRSFDEELARSLHTILFPGGKFEAAESGNQYWIAWDDSDPVGYCSVRPTLAHPNAVFLNRAGVLKPYRGKGLQRKMIQVREKWARKAEYSTAVTWVWWYNVASLKNLLRCGYVPWWPSRWGIDLRYAGKKSDPAIYLRKEL